MKVIRKLYIVLLCGVLIFLVSQCGDNNKQSENQMPADNTSENSGHAILKGNAADGKVLFQQTCSACHGMDGKGLPKLGKDITSSQFVKSESDEELINFIEKGRPVDDPLNTTGVAMPPKGGNPALTDQQISDIVAYVRELNK